MPGARHVALFIYWKYGEFLIARVTRLVPFQQRRRSGGVITAAFLVVPSLPSSPFFVTSGAVKGYATVHSGGARLFLGKAGLPQINAGLLLVVRRHSGYRLTSILC
ncbi:MAG TPA: hypothetical protein VIT91_17280 [Chthoniobacterales bacterium]